MASTICKLDGDDWPGPRMDHADFGARLIERSAAIGNPDLLRNAGNNRTESKRALLAAIETAGGRW